MSYSTLLFDLDGTLTDPKEGIVNSIIYSLKKYEITENDRQKLLKFIGPPLTESYSKYYGFSQEEAYRAVDYYREYYSVKGIFENHLYDGIADMLITLKNAGKRIVLATSKPEVYAKQILEHFKIDTYFDFVGGSTLDGSRVKKSDVIEYVLANLQLPDKKEIVMIGDREHDIIGANQNGLDSIGVLFGYGTKQELFDAGATHIVETVKDLQELLLK